MRHERQNEEFQYTSNRHSRKKVVDIKRDNGGRKRWLQFTCCMVVLCRKPKISHREVIRINNNLAR